MITDRHRVRGRITAIEGPHEDRGFTTTWVSLAFGCTIQGFGGLMLDAALADDYVRDLCVAFGVRGMDELVGKECDALYSFGSFNEPIEGLESVDTGRRFLHNAWRKKHFPETESTFEQERDRIKKTIACTKRRLAEEQERLARLADNYVDWEDRTRKR